MGRCACWWLVGVAALFPATPVLGFVSHTVLNGRLRSDRICQSVGLNAITEAKRRGLSSQETELSGAFSGWLAKQDVDSVLEVAPSPLVGGYGLFTTSAVKVGQTVATVPQSICLSAESTNKGALGKYMKDFPAATGDDGIIALQLLWEVSQGEKSRIAPWIKLLPPPGSLDLPLYWSVEELALADASSTRGFSGLKADVKDDHDWLEANVFEPNRGMFPADAFSPSMYEWAVGCVVSRAFFVDGAVRVVPLIDFANHSDGGDEAELKEPSALEKGREKVMKTMFREIATVVDFEDSPQRVVALADIARTKSEAAREPQSCGLGLFGGKGVRLVAQKAQGAGEEFFISYGARGAAAYLEEVGFLPAGDGGGGIASVEINLSIAEEDRFFDDKEDILQQAGLGLEMTFDLYPSGPPDPEMIQFARLLVLGGMDAFLLEAVFRTEVWGFMAEPISITNEAATNALIIDWCQEQLNSFAGNAEEDEVTANSVIESEAQRRKVLCARLRLTERAALQHTIDYLETDNAALERKEYYQSRRLRELNLDRPLDDSEINSGDGVAGGIPRRDGARELDW